MKIAFCFPGQGSLAQGMGRDIAEAVPEAMEVYERGSEACGLDLRAAVLRHRRSRRWSRPRCSSRRSSRPASPMLAALRVARREARLRDRALGRRVRGAGRGQVGRRSRETIALVRERGLAMAEAAKERPGSMAAILGLDDEVVERLCRKILGVWPANYNCPGQIVVSGENDAVDELLREGRGGGRAADGQAEGLRRVPLAARRARGRAAAAGGRARSSSASRRRRSCRRSRPGSRTRSGWARCSSTS